MTTFRRLAIVLACCAASGCAETMIKTKIPVASLALSSMQATITRDGIGVGAQLLGFAEMQQGRAPTIEVRWKEVDYAQAVASNSRGAEPTKSMSAKVPLVPVPALFLAIDNRSDQAIDFKQAKVWLESKKGKRFAALLNPSDVASRADLYLREHYPKAAQSDEVVDGLRARVMRMPLVQTELVIKPNTRFDGILVIDLGAFSLKDTDAALSSDEQFTVQLTELGGGSEKLSISIPFERSQSQVMAECPQKKPAVPANCKLPTIE